MNTPRIITTALSPLILIALSSISCTSQKSSYQPQAQPHPQYQPLRQQPAVITAQPVYGDPAFSQAPTPRPIAPNTSGHRGVVDLTAGNFDAIINQPGAVVLVDFAADWCGPCRDLAPTIERVAQNLAGQAIIARIDVDRDPQLAERFGVSTLPTLLYFKNGRVQSTTVGPASEQAITAKLNQLGR